MNHKRQTVTRQGGQTLEPPLLHCLQLPFLCRTNRRVLSSHFLRVFFLFCKSRVSRLSPFAVYGVGEHGYMM